MKPQYICGYLIKDEKHKRTYRLGKYALVALPLEAAKKIQKTWYPGGSIFKITEVKGKKENK